MSPRLVGLLFVAAQFVLILAIVIVPGREDWDDYQLLSAAGLGLLIVGGAIMAISALGLGAGLSAHPEPNGRGTLQTTGLYGIVRHPIYLGLLLAMLGVTVRSQSWLVAALYFTLSVLLHFKASWEERRLAEHFSGYAEYAAQVPRLIPGLKSITKR